MGLSKIHTPAGLTDEQRLYIAELKSWMKGDGIGVPVFGPSGQNGGFGIGSKSGISNWPKDIAQHLHMACNSFHLRYCELRLLNMKHDFTLSARELKILENIAIGRPDAMICGLLGLQLNSVESSIFRMLKKMQVKDRPSAILRGVGCGLISAHIIPKNPSLELASG